MTKLQELVNDFLNQKSIAIVGVSDRRDTGCNTAYERFHDAGYTIYSVNPRINEFKGKPCYPDLKSIPEKPDAVFILAKPEVTDKITDECIELGIDYLWMHCMMGVKPGAAESMTSVSQGAVVKARENGIRVIPGSCPNQFLNVDFAHKMMKGLWGLLGYNKIRP